MRTLKAKLAIEKLAAQKGISVQEIKDEINIAIKIGMNNSDPLIKQYWSKIPCKGSRPTPEELVTHLAKQVQHN